MEAPTPVAEVPLSLDQVAHSGNPAGAGWLRPLASPMAQAACWWCDLEGAQPEVDALRSLLAVDEHARAARFGTAALARRWMAGRASLRIVLGHLLAIRPEAVPLVRGPRGRPALAAAGALDFNVSHTGNAALIAIGTWARLGVDLERADREVAADRLAAKFMTADERAAMADLAPDLRRVRFLRHWTCKEAMSKATGDGLSAPLRHIAVAVEADGGLHVVAGPGSYAPAAWRLHAIAVPAPYLGTLAHWRAWRGGAP